jgi:DNA-binding Lrp family transcriptional regulator
MNEKKTLKDVELKLIAELMRNSRRSDRDLAKAIGTSQPTVTRIRTRLERDGIIQEYTMIPEFHKLGYEIFALTLASLRPEATREQVEQMRRMGREAAEKVAFESVMIIRGMGTRHQVAIASFHEDYSAYVDFKRMIASYPFVDAANIESFLVTLPDWQFKSLTFSTLGKHLLGMKRGKE